VGLFIRGSFPGPFALRIVSLCVVQHPFVKNFFVRLGISLLGVYAVKGLFALPYLGQPLIYLLLELNFPVLGGSFPFSFGTFLGKNPKD